MNPAPPVTAVLMKFFLFHFRIPVFAVGVPRRSGAVDSGPARLRRAGPDVLTLLAAGQFGGHHERWEDDRAGLVSLFRVPTRLVGLAAVGSGHGVVGGDLVTLVLLGAPGGGWCGQCRSLEHRRSSRACRAGTERCGCGGRGAALD